MKETLVQILVLLYFVHPIVPENNVDVIEKLGCLAYTVQRMNKLNFQIQNLLEKNINYLYSPLGLTIMKDEMISMMPKNVRRDFAKQHKQNQTACIDLFQKQVQTKSLQISNRVWLDKKLKLSQSKFKDFITEHVETKLELIDFKSDPKKAETFINHWISNHTNGMIKNCLPHGIITTETKLALVNTFSFHGDWMVPFNSKHTSMRKFYIGNKEVVDVLTMATTVNTRCYFNEESGHRLLELKYADERFSILLYITKKEEKLDEKTMEKLTKEMKTQKVKLFLPKFRISSNIPVRDVFRKLNYQMLFSKIDLFDEDVYFRQVIHKSGIIVDEKGTDANSATVTVTGRSMLKTFNINTPFHFFIRHLPMNAIVFSGYIRDPR